MTMRKATEDEMRRARQLLTNLFYTRLPDGSYQNLAGTVAVVSDMSDEYKEDGVEYPGLARIMFWKNRDQFLEEIENNAR